MASLSGETFRKMLMTFLEGKNDTRDAKATFKEVQQQINQFSKLKDSWPIVLQILSAEEDKKILHFASNILKDKMKYDYGQLGPEMTGELHNVLLQIIKKNSRADSGTLFNLSFCLCYLYMQEAERIGDLLTYLAMYLGNHGLLNYVFTILLILPEEVDNPKVVIEERKRNYVLQMLKSSHMKVLVELNSTGAKQWELKQVKKTTLLECFKNWVQLKYSPEVMAELPNHFLLNVSLTFLNDSDLAKECEETMISVIKQMKKGHYNENLFKYLFQRIFPLFHTIQKMQQDNIQEIIEYSVNVICRFGRYAAPLFANNVDNVSMSFQQSMLNLTKSVDIDNMESIVKYWRKFLMNVHREMRTGEKQQSQKLSVFKPLLEQLYLLLGKKGQYSQEECQDLNTMSIKELSNRYQQFEDKITYRHNIPQLYDMLGEILTYGRCVELSLQQLTKLNVGSKKMWQQFQAILLPLVDLVDQLPTFNDFLTETVGKLCQLQPPYVCVQESIIVFLARASKLYKNNKTLTQVIFTYLVSRLSDQKLNYEAAKAFENVCDNNTDFVVENIASFMEVLRTFKENELILHGIAVAVSTKEEFVAKYLPQLCRPYIQQIQKKQSVESMKVSLKRLNEIISKTSANGSQNIIIEVFKVIWPVIKPIIENPELLKDKNEKGEPVPGLFERSCKFIKVCMRSLKLRFLPYIDEVFSSIFNAYQNHPIASYVYTVEIVVTVFSQYREFSEALKNIYEKACEITFKHLSKLDVIEANPELSEDFFGMNMRFMRYAPKIVIECNKLDAVLDLCYKAIGVEDKSIANAVYGFIESLYMVMWPQPFIKHFNDKTATEQEYKIELKPQLKEHYVLLKHKMLKHLNLVKGMLVHLSKVPSESVRQTILDGLQASIKAFTEHNVEIWQNLLTSLEHDIMTAEDKKNFLEILSKFSIENLEYMREYLYMICKRFIHRKMRAPLQ